MSASKFTHVDDVGVGGTVVSQIGILPPLGAAGSGPSTGLSPVSVTNSVIALSSVTASDTIRDSLASSRRLAGLSATKTAVEIPAMIPITMRSSISVKPRRSLNKRRRVKP